MSEELKPCPFCGGEAVLWNPHQYDFRIGCKDDCIPCKIEVYNENEQDCIKAWNTRTQPPQQGGDVGEALEAFNGAKTGRFFGVIGEETKYEYRITNSEAKNITAHLTQAQEQQTAVRELAEALKLFRDSPQNEDGTPWINGGMSTIDEICTNALDKHAETLKQAEG